MTRHQPYLAKPALSVCIGASLRRTIRTYLIEVGVLGTAVHFPDIWGVELDHTGSQRTNLHFVWLHGLVWLLRFKGSGQPASSGILLVGAEGWGVGLFPVLDLNLYNSRYSRGV